jgi:hypothetical protein
MKCLLLILPAALLFSTPGLKGQSGAGIKTEGKHEEYFDSIKNSDYKWKFPIYGKRLSKKGIDLQYPWGFMVNVLSASQDVLITDLQVGINDRPMVPLDFIKFGTVTARVNTVVVRPDFWIFPFLDLYGLAGAAKTETGVSVVEPFEFDTKANFDGYTLGFGSTLAGGYKHFILIADFNVSWTTLENITGSIVAKNLSLRPGMNFRLKNNPEKTFSFWVGTSGFFVNRVTEGQVNLNDLKGNAKRSDLESIRNGSAPWFQKLTPPQKELIKAIAEHALDKLDGVKPDEVIIKYSLVKQPVSNWSMCVGAQFQFNHKFQTRVETGFLGGKKSILLSGTFRFR